MTKPAGVDFVVLGGSLIVSPVSGTVARVTNVYSNKNKNRHLRAVVITNPKDRSFETKILYVSPALGIQKGAKVIGGKTLLGTSQSLQTHYLGITDHVHIRIRAGKKRLVPISKKGFKPKMI